jgi:hypothetical protein
MKKIPWESVMKRGVSEEGAGEYKPLKTLLWVPV